MDRLDYWLMGRGMVHPAIWLMWLAAILGPINTVMIILMITRRTK